MKFDRIVLSSKYASINGVRFLMSYFQNGSHDVISRRSLKLQISNQIRIKFVLQVNVHQLTESDFWYDVILSRWRPWCQSNTRCCIQHMPVAR